MIFVVEHRPDGVYTIETVRGCEDLDTSQFTNIIGIWVVETPQEAEELVEELKELRHARPSE